MPKKGEYTSEKTRKKQSKAAVARWKRPGELERISIGVKRSWKQPGAKEKRSGKNHPMYNNHKFAGQNNPFFGKRLSDTAIKAISESAKKRWKDPIYRELTTKKILKSLMVRPTSYEREIIDLCKIYNLPFIYVGDGKVIIGYGNPDFISIDERKLIIEVGSRFWHRNCNYEENRKKMFEKYGYKTLFLWDEDLQRPDWKDVCLYKIRNFMLEIKESEI